MRRLPDLVLAGAALAALAAARLCAVAGGAVVAPGRGPVGEMCWVHAWLGVSCPFCGMTRSLVELAHGRVAAAFAYHPAGPLLAAAALWFVAWAGAALLRRRAPITARPGFARAFEVVALTCAALGAGRWLS
ncbi:MAG TPA: DUF2752 domain-containing protein [Solirubrobacteraceae bacterium]